MKTHHGKQSPLRTAWLGTLLACSLVACGGGSAPTTSLGLFPTTTGPATATVPTTPVDRVMRAGAATAGDWLTFTLNVQDFAYPERSAATVDRVITLHEQYKVPVDIYLTDTALANFEASYPRW
jgi:hypothetical protein